MRLRKRVAFERFLARLLIAAPERWVLKGAFALDLRLGLRSRTTKDIDIARKDDEQTATADLAAAAAVDLGDFFSYRVRRTRLREGNRFSRRPVHRHGRPHQTSFQHPAS